MGSLDSPFRKSSYSDTNGNCVATATAGGLVLIRDTQDRDGSTLGITPAAWATFLTTLR
jgi:hypothetical protein